MPSSRPEPRSTLYFDADGRLAGLYYNAYHARWKPDWAAPAPAGGP